MMRFSVFAPDSLAQAITLLNESGESTKVLAGGTDLLVKIKQGVIKPEKVLSLQNIANLRSIHYEAGKGLWIGPLATHAEVASNPVIRDKFTALAEASSLVGSPQVRNLGTVVGNVVNASPAADTAPALLALKGEVIIRNAGGVRSVPLSEFYCGPGQTVLQNGELVENIFIPDPAPGTASTYLKLGRRQALEIAICGVAIQARFDQGIWENVQVALGAVAPTPVLAEKASALLQGCSWSKQNIQEAGQAAALDCNPIDDQRATAAYRRAMVVLLVQRSARKLASRLGGGLVG